MSALLTFCALLLPLGTPSRGARPWEPCTGKWILSTGAQLGSRGQELQAPTEQPPVHLLSLRPQWPPDVPSQPRGAGRVALGNLEQRTEWLG